MGHAEVFGFDGVCQPDGFLTPGKDDGTVNVINLDAGAHPVTYDLLADSDDKTRWFYHRVTWKDMNQDGLLDAVTCRARQASAIFPIYDMEMVWLEQPRSEVFSQPWSTHVMNEDLADTFSIAADLSIGDLTYSVIFTCGYFSEKLVVHWTEDPQNLWTDPSLVKYSVIDKGSKYFDVEVHDVNNDGRLDLLVTINSEDNGELVVYEIPDDFRSGGYKQHLIADGFVARSGMRGGGAPGSGSIFYPDTRKTSGKPWLYLSGDDMGTAYYFKPTSEDTADWSYEQVQVVDEGEGNIIGKLTAADVDGDGYTEFFVPSYFKDLMYVYTFSP